MRIDRGRANRKQTWVGAESFQRRLHSLKGQASLYSKLRALSSSLSFVPSSWNHWISKIWIDFIFASDFMLSDLFLIFVSWSVVVMAQLAGCCRVWMILFKRWSVSYLQFFLLALVRALLQMIPVPHDFGANLIRSRN